MTAVKYRAYVSGLSISSATRTAAPASAGMRARAKDGLQHSCVAVAHALDGGGVEEVGAIHDPAHDGVGPLVELQVEVELRGAGVDVEVTGVPPGGPRRPGRLQREGDLEQRVPAGIALDPEGVGQHLERHVVVGEGLERVVSHTREQLAERRIAAQIRPQRHGIREEAQAGGRDRWVARARAGPPAGGASARARAPASPGRAARAARGRSRRTAPEGQAAPRDGRRQTPRRAPAWVAISSGMERASDTALASSAVGTARALSSGAELPQSECHQSYVDWRGARRPTSSRHVASAQARAERMGEALLRSSWSAGLW
jgi:hypothetical protein